MTQLFMSLHTEGASVPTAHVCIQGYYKIYGENFNVKPSRLNVILSSKYLGQIKAGMQSLLDCDSLSWSARHFRHRCEHCPATHGRSFTHTHWHVESPNVWRTHTYRRNCTAWQHGFPSPANRCFALSELNTRPLPPFQNSFLSVSVWSGTIGMMSFRSGGTLESRSEVIVQYLRICDASIYFMLTRLLIWRHHINIQDQALCILYIVSK